MGGACGVFSLIPGLAAAAGRPARPQLFRPSIPLTPVPRAPLNKETGLGRRSLAARATADPVVLAGPRRLQARREAGNPRRGVESTGAAPMNPAIRDELHWNLLNR